MNAQIENLVALLVQADFEYPVAFYPGSDPELGQVLEVDAFDVPDTVGNGITQRLGRILWPAAFEPETVLPGVYHVCESAAHRSSLPGGTVWYLPRRERARLR